MANKLINYSLLNANLHKSRLQVQQSQAAPSPVMSSLRLQHQSPLSAVLRRIAIVFDHRQSLIMHKFICMCTARGAVCCGSRMKG